MSYSASPTRELPGEGSATSSAAVGASFTRKSSGLIKTGSPWRIFVYVLTSFGLGVFMSTFSSYAWSEARSVTKSAVSAARPFIIAIRTERASAPTIPI